VTRALGAGREIPQSNLGGMLAGVQLVLDEISTAVVPIAVGLTGADLRSALAAMGRELRNARRALAELEAGR
jgi:hypothetical protein